MKPGALINHLILGIGTAFLTLPVLAIVLSSTHSTQTLVNESLQLSFGAHFVENYRVIFNLEAGFTDEITPLSMLVNSLIVGLGVGVVTTVFSLLTAYAIVFFEFRLRHLVFWLSFGTLLFPLEARFIPTFAIVSDLGLINSHVGIVLPVLLVALGTFFYRQFFLTLPPEYQEAARLDGAGAFRFFWDHIVPLSRSRTGAIFVISFMAGWNQYLWPLMISTDESLYTLVRGIRLIGQESGPGMALITLSLLPPLALLIVFQRGIFSTIGSAWQDR